LGEWLAESLLLKVLNLICEGFKLRVLIF
jgi:hypothetical protein